MAVDDRYKKRIALALILAWAVSGCGTSEPLGPSSELPSAPPHASPSLEARRILRPPGPILQAVHRGFGAATVEVTRLRGVKARNAAFMLGTARAASSKMAKTLGFPKRSFKFAAVLEKRQNGWEATAVAGGPYGGALDGELLFENRGHSIGLIDLLPLRAEDAIAVTGFVDPRVDSVDAVGPDGSLVDSDPVRADGGVVVLLAPGGALLMSVDRSLVYAEATATTTTSTQVSGSSNGEKAVDAARSFAESMVGGDIDGIDLRLSEDLMSGAVGAVGRRLAEGGWRILDVKAAGHSVTVALSDGRKRARFDLSMTLENEAWRVEGYRFAAEPFAPCSSTAIRASC